MVNSNLNQDLKIAKKFNDRFGASKLSNTIGSAAVLNEYKQRQRVRHQPIKKDSEPLNTKLRIAYGSESLEGHFETQTIKANDSALISTNLAVLGSPPAHLNSGKHTSR